MGYRHCKYSNYIILHTKYHIYCLLTLSLVVGGFRATEMLLTSTYPRGCILSKILKYQNIYRVVNNRLIVCHSATHNQSTSSWARLLKLGDTLLRSMAFIRWYLWDTSDTTLLEALTVRPISTQHEP